MGDILQSLLSQKLISKDEITLSAPEIASAISNRALELAHRLQETTDKKQKIDWLSAMVVMIGAISLINIALAKDTRADTRRINALLYMR